MATDYDGFAAAYDAANATNLLNAYYERPAMLELVGEARGRRILDAGCGAGRLSEQLIEGGAVVTGFDRSREMLDLARARLGPSADLHLADLCGVLPFGDDEYDDVVASLSLHYAEDWRGPLAELRRVLRPGGRLIVSVPHPSVYAFNYPEADYFEVTQYTETFEFAGQEGALTYWHRPLHAMVDAFVSGGFGISAISEPPYAQDAPAEVVPRELEGRSRFLCFVFFVLTA